MTRFSDATQKASLRAVAAMLRAGRLEGSKDQLGYHADVLGSLVERINKAEEAKRAAEQKRQADGERGRE